FFFRKLRQIFTFWSDKGVPYLTMWQYLRVVYDMYTKVTSSVIRQNYERHGRLYGSYQGIVATLVVGDPDILVDVFVKDFTSCSDRTVRLCFVNCFGGKSILSLSGDERKCTRNILSPAFTANKLGKVSTYFYSHQNRPKCRVA
ncbi:unnamed protein product, partial [Ixodes hexagonus]